MDGNYNGFYDPGVDPIGFHQVSPAVEYYAITVGNGRDAIGIDIVLDDPSGPATLSWQMSPKAPMRMSSTG